MHDGMPYGRNQGQGQGHSREVDRQSPTGLIFIFTCYSCQLWEPTHTGPVTHRCWHWCEVYVLGGMTAGVTRMCLSVCLCVCVLSEPATMYITLVRLLSVRCVASLPLCLLQN